MCLPLHKSSPGRVVLKVDKDSPLAYAVVVDCGNYIRMIAHHFEQLAKCRHAKETAFRKGVPTEIEAVRKVVDSLDVIPCNCRFCRFLAGEDTGVGERNPYAIVPYEGPKAVARMGKQMHRTLEWESRRRSFDEVSPGKEASSYMGSPRSLSDLGWMEGSPSPSLSPSQDAYSFYIGILYTHVLHIRLFAIPYTRLIYAFSHTRLTLLFC